MNILDIQDVSKSFGENTALQNVSLSISKGEIFGLLGPNGAGKSTLIRIITQIIKADSGEILIKGEKLKPEHIEVIGYLPEERGLYKKMKVGDQLMYLARLKGLEKSEAFEKIKYWIKKFEIEEWWNKKIEDLSKGMQQKVQFISTVVHDPDILILDEPFSGFDPINANLIRDEILQLRDQGCSIIFSTHRMESVEELCDHIALINNAKKILDGPKFEIKEAHKKHSYRVEYKGDDLALAAPYAISSNATLQNTNKETVIIDQSKGDPNELIKLLAQKVEIHSFSEIIPSMNDIFISKVQEVNHG